VQRNRALIAATNSRRICVLIFFAIDVPPGCYRG